MASLVHIFSNGPHRFLATMERFATTKANEGQTPMDRSAGGAAVCIMNWVTLPIVENCLKYTSPNAYTSVAMFGHGYWQAAKTSFYLIIRNKNRIGATMSVAQIIPTIGKVSVTAVTCCIFYFIQVRFFFCRLR